MTAVNRRSTARPALAVAGALTLGAAAWIALPQVGAGAAEVPDPFSDTPLGYAAMNGGTDGGFGGDNVEELLLSEYESWSEEDTAGEALYEVLNDHEDNPGDGLVLYVDETVTQDDVDEDKIDVKDVSDVSILGVGESGEFDGIGFKVTRSENVVFRNLTIHHVHEGEGDALEVTEASTNVWIDHNDFHSELEGVDKDFYDGLVDIKHNSEYVTVSWNRLHNHWKTSLVGHNDSEDSAPDQITYHHNHFSNLNTRVPLVRNADVHMLNNVFEDITGSAINARLGAEILVEGNHFDNVGSGETDSHADQIEGAVGWWYGSSETGYWNLVDNEFVDTPHEHLESTTDFTVPYEYEAESPAEAVDSVDSYSGVGVIDVTPQ